MGYSLPENLQTLNTAVQIVLDGGVIAMPWGHSSRATYALFTRADSVLATGRVNAIKGRPDDQVLAPSVIPGTISAVLDVAHCHGLALAAQRHGTDAGSLARELMELGPVGLLGPAVPGLPSSVIGAGTVGQPTALVVGEFPASEPDNFYGLFVERVTGEHGVIVAGSSCNRSKMPTYAGKDAAAAEADMVADVDLFVVARPARGRPRPWHSTVSSTVLNVTNDPVTVTRHGSIHPFVFWQLLGEIQSAPSVQRIPGRQNLLGAYAYRAMEGLPSWAQTFTRRNVQVAAA